MEFVINSYEGPESFLGLSNYANDYLTVSVKCGELNASTKVYIYNDGPSLAKVFELMASQWEGWTDELFWQSVGSDLQFTWKYKPNGHIHMTIELASDTSPWKLNAVLIIAAGQLQTISENLQLFFRKNLND